MKFIFILTVVMSLLLLGVYAQSDDGPINGYITDGLIIVDSGHSLTNISLYATYGGNTVEIDTQFLIDNTDSTDSYKYGAVAADVPYLEDIRFSYVLRSNDTFREYGGDVWIIEKNDTSSDCYENLFQECDSSDPKYEFMDICEGGFRFELIDDYVCSYDDYVNENEDCIVTFNPDCSYVLSDDNKTLEFTFSVSELVIDPTVTFSNNDVEGIEGDVVDNRTYIVIYCDETQDDTSFTVFDTNGSIINSGDIDNTNGGCTFTQDYVVDIAVLDVENELAAAVWKGSAGTPETIVFDYGGFSVSPPYVFHSGKTSGVSVARLNLTRYVAGWIDSSNGWVWSMLFNTSSNVSPAVLLDNNIGRNAQAIATTSYTDDDVNFTVAWFDSNSDQVLFTSLERNATTPDSLDILISPPVVVDSSITSTAGALSIDSFNDRLFSIGWLDTNGIFSAIRFSVYDKNGSKLVSETNIISGIGSSKSVAVSTLNTTVFGISWHDPSAVDTDFQVWNSTGFNLTSIITAFPVVNDGMQEIINTNHNASICNDNFIIASTSSGFFGGQTKSYHKNSSVWENGICDTFPPWITLLQPLNGTIINLSDDILFNYTVADNETTVQRCNLSIDGVFNQSNSSIIEGATNWFNVTNISLGFHNWSVECVDNLGNVNNTHNFSFNYFISVPPDVNVTPPTTGVNTSLQLNECPSSLQGQGILFLIVFFILGFIFGALLYRSVFVGILSSLALIVIAFTISGCSALIGLILGAIAAAMCIKFALFT